MRARITFVFFNLFIYFWLCWVFVSERGLFLVVASGGHSSLRCAGLSLSWPLLLRSTRSRRAGSVVVAHGPSCSAACGIFPDQGSREPVFPALAGRFSTTAPPGKPQESLFLNIIYLFIYLFLAVLGLSCGTRDLSLRHIVSLLWHTGSSLVVAHGLQSARAQ